MFGWRRRSEGFEWLEYVRTTVLVRRADRQRKIDDVRAAAIHKVKDTADRGVAAGRASIGTIMRAVGKVLLAIAATTFEALSAMAVLTFRIAGACILAVWHPLAQNAAALWTAAHKRVQTLLEQSSRQLPALLRPRPGEDNGHSRSRRLTRHVNVRTLAGGAVAIAVIIFIGPMLNPGSATSPAQFVTKPADSGSLSRIHAVETGSIAGGPEKL